MKSASPPSPRKRPSQARSRATFDAILRATARVLVEEGYERANTNRIAEVAGVSIGSLYQYFPNKEALIMALAEEHVDTQIRRLEDTLPRVASMPLEGAIRQCIHSLLEARAVSPELFRVLSTQVLHVGQPSIREAHCRAQDLVRMFLEARRDEIRPPDLEVAAFVVVATVDGIIHLAAVDGRRSLEILEEEIVTVVHGYLAAG